jgi:hypothetical protein
VTRAGDVVAVLDLRDEHLDVGVVTASGATSTGASTGTTVGIPRVLTDLGALDLDDAVLAHVRSVLAGRGVAVTRADGDRLRSACSDAAAELVTAAAATVTWQADADVHEVRVVASEVDARLRPRAARAIAAAAQTVATDARGGVHRVLLVGRVATLPLLSELVAERFEAPLTVLAGGSQAVARGAALLAGALGPRAQTPSEPTRGPQASHGRRAHAQVTPRRPARAAAVVGTGVIALGAAALAVSGAALAAAGGSDDARVAAVSHGVASVLGDAPGLPDGSPGAATVLRRPTLPVGSPVLGPPAGPPPAVVAHPDGPATGEQQASAG